MLLEAIAALSADRGGNTPSADAATTRAQTVSRSRAARAEITVMFSDLVGSTALSARIDPEDLRSFSAYQVVAETVGRFGASLQSTWAMACWFGWLPSSSRG
jgi:class 3 adenylate cyclase